MSVPTELPPGQLDLHGQERDIQELQQQKERVTAAALSAITAAARSRGAEDVKLTAAVHLARRAGLSWDDIGAAAGITRQGAWQRWGKR